MVYYDFDIIHNTVDIINSHCVKHVFVHSAYLKYKGDIGILALESCCLRTFCIIDYDFVL